MKFWELISICRHDGQPGLVPTTAVEREEWRRFGDWCRPWRQLVDTQSRTELDFELPKEFTHLVLGEVRLTYYDSQDGHLRAGRMWRSDEAISALEAYARYGGAVIEETLEKGAVRTHPIRVPPPIPPDVAERSAVDAAAVICPSLMRGDHAADALRALVLLDPQVTVELLPELLVIAEIRNEFPLVVQAIGRIPRAELAKRLHELVLERLDDANYFYSEYRRLAELLDQVGLDETLSTLVERALASADERKRKVGRDYRR